MQKFNVQIPETGFMGFNDTQPSHLLSRGVFTKVDNAYVADNKIVKVPGSTSIATAVAAKDINGLFAFEITSTSTKKLVFSLNGASNAQLYTWGGSGAFSAIGSANLTNSLPVSFELANDYLFGFNGAEVVDVASDGTTVTKNRAGVPLGNFSKWFHNYLFVARTTANPNRLFWSNLGDPTTFSGSNYVDVNPGDSDSCTGLGVLQDELFFFKKNSIWSITGWSGTSFSSTTIATQNTNAKLLGYGCVSPESIVSTGNDIYFVSFLGKTPVIRSLKKTQFATTLGGGIISTDIVNTMDSINKNVLSKIVGTYDGRYVMWAIPTGSSTSNNKIIGFDTWSTMVTRRGRLRYVYPWITITGKNAGHFTISTISGSALVYFSSATANGKVYKIDTSVYSDDGSPVVMDVRTRDYMGGEARQTKWKYLYLKYGTGSAGTLDINARIEQATAFTNQESLSLAGNSPGLGSFILGTSTLGGSMVSENRVTFAQLTGYIMGLQFYEDSANACTIYDFQIYGIRKGMRNA